MQYWGRRREVEAGVERQRQRGGQGDQSQCSNIAVPGSSEPSVAWPARCQHCANIMEAFGDESYVGIKEMTMDMKVKLLYGESVITM